MAKQALISLGPLDYWEWISLFFHSLFKLMPPLSLVKLRLLKDWAAFPQPSGGTEGAYF
jgi:hypothetical protein